MRNKRKIYKEDGVILIRHKTAVNSALFQRNVVHLQIHSQFNSMKEKKV